MQMQKLQPILVLDPIEAARLQREHHHLHVSFDLFSTELQRLEVTKLFLPQWHYPEQENNEEWAGVPSPSPVIPQKIPHTALDVQIQSYRSYSVKRNSKNTTQDEDNDTTCAELDYQLQSEDETQQ